MTDRQVLKDYRWQQATETLAEAEHMLATGFSPRSVINRAYYAMFYAVQALFIFSGTETKTSKHSGVISVFDREFILTGKLDPKFSRSMHRLFEARQKADYKELVEVSLQEAEDAMVRAREFIQGLSATMSNSTMFPR